MDLLFELAMWHALAKLRLHTESTIVDLEHSTRHLGKAIRSFKENLCADYVAYDLPAEDAPCSKKRKAKAKKVQAKKAQEVLGQPGSTKPSKKICELNLSTYKLHALGHYADAIQRFGLSDGYSTQGVRIYI